MTYLCHIFLVASRPVSFILFLFVTEIMYYMLQKDVDRVKYLLSAIERRGFAGDIPHEVAKAKASIVAMPKKSPKPRPAAVIDVPTLAEIGRYHNPPAIVHRMFMAVLLLMGVHEGITKVHLIYIYTRIVPAEPVFQTSRALNKILREGLEICSTKVLIFYKQVMYRLKFSFVAH